MNDTLTISRDTQTAQTTTVDLTAVKKRQQTAWSSGDYAVVGTTLQIVGEELCEALDLRTGETVLDVAAGNGNATLAAARRWADVVSTDYVPSLLERGRDRAAAEGLSIEFRQADAEALPFADGTFDVTISTFGVMFTPDQNKAASELMRVCNSGGKIAMANWTPEGFAGQMFKTNAKHVPPPPGMPSPVLWGTEDAVKERLSDGISDLKMTRTPIMFNYPFSPADVVEYFRTYFGPTQKAFESLDEDGQAALRTDLEALWSEKNRATDGSTEVESEYLEVLATKA